MKWVLLLFDYQNDKTEVHTEAGHWLRFPEWNQVPDPGV